MQETVMHWTDLDAELRGTGTDRATGGTVSRWWAPPSGGTRRGDALL
jgi:hypothetical protein